MLHACPGLSLRVEVAEILKQKAIQASMTGYTFTIVAQVLVLIVFVPSVLAGDEGSLSSYIFVFSLILMLRINAIAIVMRCLVLVFDTQTSLWRIQVSSLPSPPLSLTFYLSLFLPPRSIHVVLWLCGVFTFVSVCLSPCCIASPPSPPFSPLSASSSFVSVVSGLVLAKLLAGLLEIHTLCVCVFV